MNIKNVSSYIIKDAARNLGWDDDQGEDIAPYLTRMEQMNGKEVFNCYCNWNGFIQWGNTLWNVANELREIE